MAGFEEIRRQTASEQVEYEIKKYILENNLRPGDPLPTETEMAEMLGTSRTTVREALRVLQFLGVVKTKQRMGPVVADTNLDILVDYFVFSLQFGDPSLQEFAEARRIIETAILSLVVERATAEDFQLMKSIVEAGAKGPVKARFH
ncbi:MAG: GntR family transcriptional regulator [Limnochordia bacterium]|nr:GntR family transcriptional regulator [Limnochordia bacterium]